MSMNTVRRSLISGVAAITLIGAMGGSAQAVAPASEGTTSSSTSATSARSVGGDGVNTHLRDRIVRQVQSAKSTLAVGDSRVVYRAQGAKLVLSQASAGNFDLRVAGVGGADTQQFGFCHAGAMAAVYAIGAAAFAAAALVGGITVVGVAISAQAASAMSVALAAGSGVSALVAAYIC